MKYILPVILVAIFLMTPLYPVYAQTATNSALIGQQLRQDLATINSTRSASLKKALQRFRDQKKAVIVQRVNDTLAMINKNRTDMMKKHLQTMTDILTRLENRVNQPATQEAITQAKTAIQNASQSVDTQSQKEYTIVVSSESTVKTDAQTARQNLFTDLKTTHQQVVDARQALVNAIEVAAQAMKDNKNGQ